METTQKARKNSLMLCHYLSPSHILILSGPQNKQEVVNQLLDKMGELSQIVNLESIKNAVWEREKEGRTVLENGLAIPHARVPHIDELKACLAILPQGYLDPQENVLVKEVFLFLSPQEQFEAHLQMLAKISRVFQDSNFIEQLLNASSADAVFTLIQKQERT